MEGRRCSAAVASCCLLALALLVPQIAAAEGATQAPQPAMTRTNIAQQVQELANVPALYNVPAPAPVTLPAASAVNQFQSTSNAQPSTQAGQREQVKYQWAPQAAPEAQPTSQQQTAASAQAATQPAQRAGPGQLPPLPQQLSASGKDALPAHGGSVYRRLRQNLPGILDLRRPPFVRHVLKTAIVVSKAQDWLHF